MLNLLHFGRVMGEILRNGRVVVHIIRPTTEAGDSAAAASLAATEPEILHMSVPTSAESKYQIFQKSDDWNSYKSHWL